MQKPEQFQSIANLETHGTLSKVEKHDVESYLLYLYDKTDCSSLNDLRCDIASKKNVLPKKRPPTEDSFNLHLQRFLHQLKTWREATMAVHEIWDSSEFEFEKIPDGFLEPRLNIQAPATLELSVQVWFFKTLTADHKYVRMLSAPDFATTSLLVVKPVLSCIKLKLSAMAITRFVTFLVMTNNKLI